MMLWTCCYTVVQYTFVILLPFPIIKKCTRTKNKKQSQEAELAACWGVFSAVTVDSIPGNAALQAQPPALFYHDGKSVTAFPSAALASRGLKANAACCGVRGKDLFICLLLSPLAARFPLSLAQKACATLIRNES